MRGTSHLALGAAASLTLLAWGPIPGAAVAAGMLGGLMPDLDASESTIKHWAIPLGGGARVKPFWLPAVVVSALTRHRGPVHSLAGLAVAAGLAAGLAVLLGLPGARLLVAAFALGYLSHLLGDALTRTGVPLFYPLRRGQIHLLPGPLRLRLGGVVETALDYVLGPMVLAVIVGLTLRERILW